MLTPYNTNLPPDLRSLKEEIEGYARDYGLDFYDTIFEVIDADDLNEIAAYGGFPTRYPHWSFGMSYEELRKSYTYGLSKIYEMVINNDPCYAYLMRCNHVVDQKLVMAHVYGHCLAPETLVVTRGGEKPIRDVVAGELVLTHTGSWRRVRLCARRWFKGGIYRVTVGDGAPVRITGEHPVYVSLTGSATEKGVLEWVPAAELVPGSLVAVRPPSERNPQTGNRRPLRGPIPLASGGVLDLDATYILEHVREIEQEDYEGHVYNFSVEGDESYTLADRLIVHNCDFFKNNAYFSHTNRKMMDEMANHGARIRRYVEKYGEDEVEAFLDRCMSIDDLIDIHSTAIKRRDTSSRFDFTPQNEDEQTVRATRFKSKGYMDEYINPPDVLRAEEDERRKEQEKLARSFPEQPEKDVLLFLIENAPLKTWQRDVLSIVRDEAFYFTPQGMTKIMNEGWACAEYNTLVCTDLGLLKLGDIVEQRLPVMVSDGQQTRGVYDHAAFHDRETVRIRTRRGFELCGSLTHQILLDGEAWKRLDEVVVGDRVMLPAGTDLWAKDFVRLDYQPANRITLDQAAETVGVNLSTVIRYRKNGSSRSAALLEAPLARYETELALLGQTTDLRCRDVTLPEVVDENLASFLGYLIGDGHVSARKRTIGLTTADEPQADHFARLASALFGVGCRKRRDESKWRVSFSSRRVQEFLRHLGLGTGFCARTKTVPDVIMRSPKPVVAAFLRSLYDCDGHAGPTGVILVTASEEMSRVVQLLLLNFGILASRYRKNDGCWHVYTGGASLVRFETEVGFGLGRKQRRLRDNISGHFWFHKQEAVDEIVSVEHGRADVYDVSVETTHRYSAGGFVNHNSYWHSTIMTQKALSPSEVIDYAEHHSGTVAMHGARLNPYKLGLELLRDIEFRWNTGRFGKEWDECDDPEKRRTWDRQLGLGRKKIFEVRRIHNDITFIDTFLTPEFCVEYKLFSWAYQEQNGVYYIESRDFAKIKQRLLFSLTNFGKPWIYVVDGNYRNRGELLLLHQFNGVELKMDQAADTLVNIQFIWSRPVHLQTVVDGKPTLLSFDGSDHSIRTGGEIDELRRNAPAKTS